MLRQVNCRIPSLCAQLLDSHCGLLLMSGFPDSSHSLEFALLSLHLRYQSFPLVFPNCFLGMTNLVVPVRDPSGSSDFLWIHWVRASSPSFEQIAEPVCLLWILQHSKPCADSFSFVFPKGPHSSSLWSLPGPQIPPVFCTCWLAIFQRLLWLLPLKCIQAADCREEEWQVRHVQLGGYPGAGWGNPWVGLPAACGWPSWWSLPYS